jgi:hypothetical protein
LNQWSGCSCLWSSVQQHLNPLHHRSSWNVQVWSVSVYISKSFWWDLLCSVSFGINILRPCIYRREAERDVFQTFSVGSRNLQDGCCSKQIEDLINYGQSKASFVGERFQAD